MKAAVAAAGIETATTTEKSNSFGVRKSAADFDIVKAG